MKRFSILALALALTIGASAHLFAQNAGSEDGAANPPPFCPLGHMIDLLEGVLDDPDGGCVGLEMLSDHLEELCDGEFLSGLIGGALDGESANGVVTTRVFTLGPDGEMVEVDSNTETLAGGMFDGSLLDLDLDDILDFDSISDSIATLLEDLPPFDATLMQDLDFDFDFGGADFECFELDLQDLDLGEFDLGGLLPEGFDLGGMISGGVTGGISTRVMTIGPDGALVEMSGGDFDPATLGLPGCEGSLDAILDLLEDFDLDGVGGAHAVVRAQAFTLGPDGEWISISGDDEGAPDLDGIIEQIEDALGGDE